MTPAPLTRQAEDEHADDSALLFVRGGVRRFGTISTSDASAQDAFTPDGGALDSCEALVLAFVGCDTERLHECEREYHAVSATNQGLIDTAVVCLETRIPGLSSATWPPATATCTPTAIRPISSSNSQWFHGGCEGDNGNAVTQVTADPAFPSCASDGGQPECFFGLDNSGATL